jgi:hypothetical protein
MDNQEFAKAVDYYYAKFQEKDHMFDGLMLDSFQISIADVRFALAEFFFNRPDEIDAYSDTAVREQVIERCIELVNKQEVNAITKVIDLFEDHDFNFDPQSKEYQWAQQYLKLPTKDLETIVLDKLKYYMSQEANKNLGWTEVIYNLSQRGDTDEIPTLIEMMSVPADAINSGKKPISKKIKVIETTCKISQGAHDKTMICNPVTGNWIKKTGGVYNKLLTKFSAAELQAFSDKVF